MFFFFLLFDCLNTYMKNICHHPELLRQTKPPISPNHHPTTHMGYHRNINISLSQYVFNYSTKCTKLRVQKVQSSAIWLSLYTIFTTISYKDSLHKVSSVWYSQYSLKRSYVNDRLSMYQLGMWTFALFALFVCVQTHNALEGETGIFPQTVYSHNNV